jgi:hypothetical protein
MIKTIKTSILKLSDMPHKYALVGDERLAAMGYRKKNIKNYMAFFTIDEETTKVSVPPP